VYKILFAVFCMTLGVAVCANESAHAEVRDPTAPLGHRAIHVADSNPQFDLSSVLISPTRKLATINGSALREGQIVPGSANVKVQKISKQAVVLQQADQTWVLRLSPSILKKH
jgi:MSHA biogenesis protein MshK